MEIDRENGDKKEGLKKILKAMDNGEIFRDLGVMKQTG
jgi:hypothetical protein